MLTNIPFVVIQSFFFVPASITFKVHEKSVKGLECFKCYLFGEHVFTLKRFLCIYGSHFERRHLLPRCVSVWKHHKVWYLLQGLRILEHKKHFLRLEKKSKHRRLEFKLHCKRKLKWEEIKTTAKTRFLPSIKNEISTYYHRWRCPCISGKSFSS